MLTKAQLLQMAAVAGCSPLKSGATKADIARCISAALREVSVGKSKARARVSRGGGENVVYTFSDTATFTEYEIQAAIENVTTDTKLKTYIKDAGSLKVKDTCLKNINSAQDYVNAMASWAEFAKSCGNRMKDKNPRKVMLKVDEKLVEVASVQDMVNTKAGFVNRGTTSATPLARTSKHDDVYKMFGDVSLKD